MRTIRSLTEIFKNIPFKELGDLVTSGCLSITACCLSTGILGTGGVSGLLSSFLCFLARLSVRSGRTSSCCGVVGSYLNNELASDYSAVDAGGKILE